MFPSDHVELTVRAWSWRRLRYVWQDVLRVYVARDGALVVDAAPTARPREAVSPLSETAA